MTIREKRGALSPRTRPAYAPLLTLLLALSAALPASAQEEPYANNASRDMAPRVFLDCGRCDFTHIRSEIRFVNYVRDPAHAHVHVIITDQGTGAGSRQYTLRLLGRGSFSGADNILTYTTRPAETWPEERDGLARILKLALVPYVARTPLAARVDLTFHEPDGDVVPETVDPWLHWTFEIYGGGNMSTETTQSAWNARYGFYANRVTDDWKVRLRPYFNNNVRTIRQEDEEPIRVDLRRHGFESYVIRSLGDHFGAGIFGHYTTSTIDNLAHALTVAPAVEYSFFPYGEAASRQITLSYRVGYELADYIEETIYEKFEDALLQHSLEAAVRIRQPWGSIFSGLTGSNYLHDPDLHRLTFNGNVSFRLGHGISLNVGGNYQRINDQVSLPRGDASLEDILLQRRRLATSYRTASSVGLSYNFGSIFTNVVNPRL